MVNHHKGELKENKHNIYIQTNQIWNKNMFLNRCCRRFDERMLSVFNISPRKLTTDLLTAICLSNRVDSHLIQISMWLNRKMVWMHLKIGHCFWFNNQIYCASCCQLSFVWIFLISDCIFSNKLFKITNQTTRNLYVNLFEMQIYIENDWSWYYQCGCWCVFRRISMYFESKNAGP